MVKTCIRLPNIADKSYFGYTFQRIHNDANNNPTLKVDLAMYAEDNNTICLPDNSPNGFLANFCKIGQECDYLKFKLWLCGTPDSKNPAHWNESGKCQPFPRLVEVMQTNYVDFVYYTHIGGVLFHTAPKVNASAQYFSIFQLNQTKRNPDLLRWWVESSMYNIQHQRDTFAIQYYYGPIPDKEVLELQMVLGSEALLTVENRKTSLDLIGSFGALWGVIFSVLAIVFLRYNENKFYEKNPRWGRIDPAFKVEEGADTQISSEATKLIDQQGTSDASMLAYGDYTQ